MTRNGLADLWPHAWRTSKFGFRSVTLRKHCTKVQPFRSNLEYAYGSDTSVADGLLFIGGFWHVWGPLYPLRVWCVAEVQSHSSSRGWKLCMTWHQMNRTLVQDLLLYFGWSHVSVLRARTLFRIMCFSSPLWSSLMSKDTWPSKLNSRPRYYHRRNSYFTSIYCIYHK